MARASRGVNPDGREINATPQIVPKALTVRIALKRVAQTVCTVVPQKTGFATVTGGSRV